VHQGVKYGYSAELTGTVNRPCAVSDSQVVRTMSSYAAASPAAAN